MENCIFCKIINGEIPSAKVYEDEFVYAFNDIKPVAPIHVIIVPKEHIESVNDICLENSMYISKVFETIPKIAEKLNIAKDGYRVVANVGENGGQTVKHLHFHIIGGIKLGEKII
jgi:histidine triad (HIT) family protein